MSGCLSGPTCGLCKTRLWLMMSVRPITGPHWRTLGVAATRVWAGDREILPNDREILPSHDADTPR